MKFKYILLSTFFLSIQLTFSGITPIKPGTALPLKTTALQDISGKEITLESSTRENGLLVVFSCNTCPFVMAWQDRYPAIAEKAHFNKIGMVVLNPNEAKRNEGESFVDMKTHAKKYGYLDTLGQPLFHYAMDSNHKLADAFGATRTPEIFLFDKNGNLVYQGAIDDNGKEPQKVKHTYLMDALTNLNGNKPIEPTNTKSLGCSIKRVH